MKLLTRFLQGYAPFLLPRQRARLMRLVEMHGITQTQQRQLYDLVLDPSNANLDSIRTLMNMHEKRGALPKYDTKGVWIEYPQDG